jgi:hypothetical protein
MPKGQNIADPVVDPLRVWQAGFVPELTLAEKLAEGLEPRVAPDKRELTPGEQVKFFGSAAPAYQEPVSNTGVMADALLGPPLGREPAKLDGLDQFKPPDLDEAHVLPLQVDEETPGYQDGQENQALPAQACPAGHESPAAAKFCMECGEPFAPVPPASAWLCVQGHLSSPAAKFCTECGDARPDLKPPVSGAGVAAELAARPVPMDELTPAQQADRERQHAAALRAGRADAPLVYQRPSGQRPTILIHVLKSGWTFAGQVWYRGQEIELEEGTARWQEAQRFIGWDDAEQMERYGRVCWRKGPWPYRKNYSDIEPGSYQQLAALDGKGQISGPGEEQLRLADQQERRRARGVPQPMFAQARSRPIG